MRENLPSVYYSAAIVIIWSRSKRGNELLADLTSAVPCRTRIKPWGLGYEVFLCKSLENFPLGDTARMHQEVAKLIRPNPQHYF